MRKRTNIVVDMNRAERRGIRVDTYWMLEEVAAQVEQERARGKTVVVVRVGKKSNDSSFGG